MRTSKSRQKSLLCHVIAIFCVVTLSSGAVVNSAEKGVNPAEQAININNFMPSHQVLFRRNEGELLLPAVNPYQGDLQVAASERNSANSYGYKRPSYEEVNQQEPTCLLRTCDQYITGRDLTYERALEIVQNEEYLVAVDADLIHRRQDYGRDEDFGTTWNNLPLDDHLKLTQYLATVGKRKKREAEPEAEIIPEELSKTTILKADDYGGRFFNISGTGLGTVSYDWTSVADNYLKLGAATALLFGLAGMIPSPEEPVLPITLRSSSSSKVSKSETDEEDFFGPYDIGDETRPVYQVYQEDAPSRTGGQVDRIDMAGILDKIPDNAFLKRFDLLAPFRRNKKPKRRPNRPNRPNRPGKGPNPAILKPVQNTKKRNIQPKPVQKAPEPVAKTPALSVQDEIAQVETPDLKVPQQNGDMERAPFLTSGEFESFFPSWSRKKRATLVKHAKIFNFFNVTSTGFGTVTYPWQDVVGTYGGYLVTGGLILAAASLLTIPSKPLIPLDLNSLDTLLPANKRINPYSLPPNLPEGLVPPGNPLPGQLGGGARPIGLSPEAQEALALVPRGTIPVSTFPPYTSLRTVPAVSVIFLETATPGLVKRQGIWGGIDNLARSYNCMKAKILRKKRSPDPQNYKAPLECQPELLYGFRSRVSIVENQSCILDVTCTATGDRINVALTKRRGSSIPFPDIAQQQSFSRRQTGEEFQSDAPPQCRAILDQSNTCRAYLAPAV